MDYGINMTYITLGGHVEVHKYGILYFVAFLIIYILALSSNSVIVYLIFSHKNLHEPMYIFIAALLINSIIFSTNIYPKLLFDFVSEKQIISYPACVLQFVVFYSVGGAEFLLLAVMAYDRYASICKPLQYHTIMRKSNVITLLVLAWLLPSCQVAATVLSEQEQLCHFTLKGVFCNNRIFKLRCVLSQRQLIIQLFILINVAFLPILFIVFTYLRILIICYQSKGKEVRKKAAQTCLPHLIVLICFSCFCAYDVITLRFEFNLPKTLNLALTLQVVLYHPLINPVIYGLKMKEIHKHLKALFCQSKRIKCMKNDS